jgi:tetratricopeptide (TPR) repeat protein
MHVRKTLVLFAFAALLMPHSAAAQDNVLELVVENQTSSVVTVFVRWRNGGRVRLGELRQRGSETYTTPYRSSEVALSVDVLGGPAAGARAGAFTFGPDGNAGGRGNSNETYVDVEAGDRMEFQIRSVEPLDVFYQRLSYDSGPESVFSAEIRQRDPRVSRYTALSALRIREAQSTEDEVLQLESYREALEAIYDGLERETDNPEAYLHLGIVQTGLGNYLAADSALDRAEAMHPNYAVQDGGTRAYRFNGWLQAYNAATVRLDEQDPEGAVELFRAANVLFDMRPEAYLNLGAQLAGLNDLEGSIEAWRGALAVIASPDADPGDDETREAWDTQFWMMAQSNLGRVLELAGRPEEAITAYETLLERDPDNAEARSSLALALAAAGQGDDALTIFDEILGREDAAALDYYNAGVSLYTADRLEQAVIGFEKALERAPMYRDALQNLAQSLNGLEDYEAQIPYSERLLELDPHNEYGYQMHIRALVQAGRQADGVAVLAIMRELPFVTDNFQLQLRSAGAIISGQVINKTLAPGTTVTLRFTFYDDASAPIGTQDVEVTLSDPEVAHPFQISFDAEFQVLGYGYEFLN